VTDVQEQNRQVLAAVRVRRDRLYDAILELERGLAVPAGEHPREWAADIGAEVGRLRTVLDAHVEETEADGGFFADVRERAPQLLHAVTILQDEHRPLIEAAGELADHAAAVQDESDVDEVRDEAVELIRRLLHHRHRGAELVYDAYSVDISAAD
jgi:hypothetical protein